MLNHSSLHKIASGSVKDIYSNKEGNELHFLFSDRVSVFDYGAIPENIPQRGEALARFAQNIFGELSLPSVYLGPSDLGAAALRMKQVSHPKFDLQSDDLQFLPLEIIFRWGVPEGSKLAQKGYKIFERFSEPKINFTTKLETFDRDLTQLEAQKMLPPGLETSALDDFAIAAATQLKDLFAGCGLTLWDGKIEIAYHQREQKLYLIDAITPDELRLTVEDFPRVPLSKEILRRWYQKTTWPFELQKLKNELGQSWKQHAPAPPKLGDWRTETFSQLFISLCETLEQKSPEPVLRWIQKEPRAPKVFVAGKGGRETALTWKLAQEGCEVLPNSERADAIFVSNDGDLAHGLINQLAQKREWAIGPAKEAAHIEWSKVFGKKIADNAKIPIARWTTDAAEARAKTELPVIKQDGLAAGKGVVLPNDLQEFDATVAQWSQHKLLFEERLHGEEASVFFWIHPSGETFGAEFLGAAQDYKRRFEHDRGPNTGGMGAKSPHPSLTDDDIKRFQSWAIQTAVALRAEGIIYSGVLFMGLLNDAHRGWVLLEYNARFGDPETQALVLRWQNKRLLRSYLGLSLDEDLTPHLDPGQVVCVALVNPSYPVAGEALVLPEWDSELEFSDDRDNVRLFLTGSTSGRVAYLCVKDPRSAGDKAQRLLAESPWSQALAWRKDIS